jgi:hypothetical protein
VRPITPKTLKALELVKQGMTPYRAAKTAGISLCTIYRHTKRLKGPEEALQMHVAVQDDARKHPGLPPIPDFIMPIPSAVEPRVCPFNAPQPPTSGDTPPTTDSP